MKTTRQRTTRFASAYRLIHLAIFVAVILASSLWVLLPQTASAGQITSRKLALSTSAGNTAATWTFTFTPNATTALNGITFQVCTTASSTCTIPTSWTNSGSAFSTLTYNGSNQTGWALDNAAGYLRIKNNTSAATATGPIVVTFTTVTNPNTTNETFFARVLTYTGDDYTGQLDSGVVAASTAQQITVTASVDETLTFCSGTSGVTSSSCAGATGSTSALGTLTSSATGANTSQLGVGTNADSGYAITINGTTLTSGGNTITALATPTASSFGSEQFGVNLRANTTPVIGSNPAGSGSGAPTTDYNTVDSFKFVTGDIIASNATEDLFRLFTVSYIANITTITEPGSYSAVMTYICTATF